MHRRPEAPGGEFGQTFSLCVPQNQTWAGQVRSGQVSSQWRTSAFTAATAHASVTQSDGFRTHFALTPCVRCQVRGMAEADARKLFQQLLVALEACHARGVANRDIKVRACAHFPFLLGKDHTGTTLGDTAIPCFRVDIRVGLCASVHRQQSLRPCSKIVLAVGQHPAARGLAGARGQDLRLWVLEGRERPVLQQVHLRCAPWFKGACKSPTTRPLLHSPRSPKLPPAATKPLHHIKGGCQTRNSRPCTNHAPLSESRP